MFSKGLIVFKKKEIPAIARGQIKSDLTVVPLDTLEPIILYQEIGDEMAVPRGYFQEVISKRFEPETKINFSIGRNATRTNEEIKYREGQKKVVDECVAALKSKPYSGVILEAKTGTGKTPLTLEIARQLGHKTLVVVHTSVLFEQWMKEIKIIMPNWSVGAVQGETMDVDNNDICVGMLQSLALKKDYPEKMFEEFGTIIIDECDRVSSAEFHKALIRFCPQYIIGATGTLKRKDKAENVIKYCIGPTVSAMGKIPSLDPVVYLVDTKYLFSSGIDQGVLRDDLLNNDERNVLIANNAENAALSGRNVLILANRVAHAETLYRMLVNRTIRKNLRVGLLIGETDNNMREISQTANIIVATTQLIAVGFNEPRLDTLIFANPIQDMTQAVGRILRVLPNKRQPMVIDLVDTSYASGVRMAKERLSTYELKGWKIVGAECLGITYGKLKNASRNKGVINGRTKIRRVS